MTPLRRRRCAACDAPVNRLRAFRFQRHAYCSHSCEKEIRNAYAKAHHDLADESGLICRCSGAPAPLEPAGPHCVRCRRLFSSGVRLMLAEPRRRSLRSILYAEVSLRPRLT